MFKEFFNVKIFALALIFACPNTLAQQSKLSKSVNYISEFIASNHFLEIKKTYGDLVSVDSIYLKALEINDNYYSETLLSLTFATVPYKEVPIQIPLIKIILNYPLVSASDSIFNLKNENLPRYMFFDSPIDSYGDKDKLAHFFGSSFISYSSNIFDFGNPIGYFIEVFEETFKVQASVDERDLITNSLGNIFGKMLKRNKNILPSQIMILKTLSYFTYTL